MPSKLVLLCPTSAMTLWARPPTWEPTNTDGRFPATARDRNRDLSQQSSQPTHPSVSLAAPRLPAGSLKSTQPLLSTHPGVMLRTNLTTRPHANRREICLMRVAPIAADSFYTIGGICRAPDVIWGSRQYRSGAKITEYRQELPGGRPVPVPVFLGTPQMCCSLAAILPLAKLPPRINPGEPTAQKDGSGYSAPRRKRERLSQPRQRTTAL